MLYLISDDDIHECTKLRKLSVENNFIEQIDDALLQKSPHLESIFAENNMITEMLNLSAVAQSIITASLAHNSISAVESSQMRGLARLDNLTVSSNHIKTFPFSSLADMNKISYLGLHQNNLSEVPDLTKLVLSPGEIEITLYKNRLNCSNLCWMKKRGIDVSCDETRSECQLEWGTIENDVSFYFMYRASIIHGTA